MIPVAINYPNLSKGINLRSVEVIDPELFININNHRIYIIYN